MASHTPLGDREMDIMQELWRLGTATVGEVQQGLVAAGRDVAYNTVQTMLNRLEEKGLVRRDASDRAHRYRPLLKEKTVVGGAIRSLTSRFFAGSAEALAARLVESELDDEEIERLRKRIDQQRKRSRT
jgi:BlaI family transcriptional regulator, penicillinase repressor